jgi:16S rRNA (guanine966-N2)-methyltransferase
MRIIAGRWRGRKLVAPPGQATRPTADRTREALFNMLASRLGGFDDLAVADLFAGSGALGLEALSRGAATALFVETDPQARRAIEANAQSLGCDSYTIAAHSALRLPPGRTFDLLLADPPYTISSGSQARAAVDEAGWLAPGGWLAIETSRGDPVEPGELAIEAERDSGAARLTLLRRPA